MFESVISKVLRNSFYCGIMTYHKYYCPDYLKQNRVKNMGEIEMTYTKGTHEPIVTEEEFNLVQARMDARTIIVQKVKELRQSVSRQQFGESL